MAELAEAGITFSRVPPHRADEVMTLLWDHFIPHEPLSRSLNITESKPGTLQNYLIEMLFKDAIKTGKSVMAEKDGKIVGVRVAEVLERTGWARWCTDKIFDLVVDYGLIWLFDRKLHRICKINKLLISKWLGYNVWNTFNTYNCDKVLSAICLCSVNSGIRGVGTELVKQSEELGREEGCAMTSVVVTGLYSGKIFSRCGYEVKSEVKYDEFRDGAGELYLNDTREHTEIRYCVKRLLD